MAVVSVVPTLTDLVGQFGAIPISRIRTVPIPGQATEHHVIDIEQHENRLFELYDGILVEKVMGFYESYLAVVLVRYLSTFVDQHRLGIVVGEAGMLQLLPGEVRIPDISFISWQRLPSGQIPRTPIPHLVPDLVVEVISQGNTVQEMDRKLREYLDAGVRLVWYVYPQRRVVVAYTSVTDNVELADSQSLDGGQVLPGFLLPLAALFNVPPGQEPQAAIGAP